LRAAVVFAPSLWESDTLIGRSLAHYRITAAIGAGGMGEVYRATDTKLGREFAIKVLPSVTASDPDRRQRFEQAARSASALNHPNILTIHDIGEADGLIYIAMGMEGGVSLARWQIGHRSEARHTSHRRRART